MVQETSPRSFCPRSFGRASRRPPSYSLAGGPTVAKAAEERWGWQGDASTGSAGEDPSGAAESVPYGPSIVEEAAGIGHDRRGTSLLCGGWFRARSQDCLDTVHPDWSIQVSKAWVFPLLPGSVSSVLVLRRASRSRTEETSINPSTNTVERRWTTCLSEEETRGKLASEPAERERLGSPN